MPAKRPARKAPARKPGAPQARQLGTQYGPFNVRQEMGSQNMSNVRGTVSPKINVGRGGDVRVSFGGQEPVRALAQRRGGSGFTGPKGPGGSGHPSGGHGGGKSPRPKRSVKRKR
ncbi:MAG TPA: hypothetical protein VJA40_02175 [archaeon]|nr:hypothetical protein [archaeon]